MISYDYKGKNILITGGLGFIGSNLAHRLISIGANVTIVDSMIEEYGGNIYNIDKIKKNVSLNISDIRDPNSLKYLIKNQDYLFNLAGQVGHIDSMKNPINDMEINCKAQIIILESCRHYNPKIKIVYTSTRQIYGKPKYLPVDENHPVNPVDVNGINKAAGEKYHILYHNIYGIQATVLRLTNTYGPGMRIKDARQTFIGYWIRLLLQGENIEVWGGDQLRDLSYVDDVIDALLNAAQNKKAYGEVFNVGGMEKVSLKQLAELMIEKNSGGQYILKEFPEYRKKIDIGNYYTDWSKIKNVLNWQPKTTLAEGLSQTLKYYRENIEHYI